ncbi:MAG: putative Retinol dehydrogenase 13 [Proteobacteria bacterium]|nr:putative Retinol dehydrogenase 13 [Pseudomonadota bacterium]
MESNHLHESRVALVTGATGAIGKAIARQIAATQNVEVVLLCRNPEKAERAVNEIKSATGNGKVSHATVDLSLRSSIEAFAASWSRPVHVLVNNAVIAPHTREETSEGIELQFATNVLGYWRLTRALEDHLVASTPARVVNVASYWAGDLDLHDLEFKRRRYDQHQAYRQSKQANRMLTVAFAERLKPHGIAVNACHSGDVHSALSHALGFGGHESPDQGAATPVWLATDPQGQAVTGKYFEHGREVRCRFAENKAQVTALDEACRRYDE